MIIYFADRQLNIIGQASTELPGGLTIDDDCKGEEVETGVAVFDFKIPFNNSTRAKIEECAAVGNYILRSHEDENEFYTIIDSEVDTKRKEVYVYAEDAGLDLLNEVVGKYEADKAYPIRHYIEKFAYDSGFIIGINEAAGLSRKLSWDGEATATERLASVATQFGGYEISYSFDIKGLEVKNKYINIHKKRGQDNGAELRLNKNIDRIIAKRSIANLATALECTGGTPEDAEDPITIEGYEYDDGDFYVSGKRLYSREAVKKWSRYNWAKEPNQLDGEKGHIVKQYSYDTTNKATLCAHAITELKKAREIEVNYEITVSELPEGTKVGDRLNVIDDDGELYVSSRILKLETSVVNKTQSVTLGEYLIRGSGISQKVLELAEQFAKTAQSASRALGVASIAKTDAVSAQETADAANEAAEQALAEIEEIKESLANQPAALAMASAEEAQEAVASVEERVASLETTVNNAQAAADNAQLAADTATTKANEAAQAAANALADAAEASKAAELAQSKATTATEKAETAQSTAETAKSEAETAQATADAAKLDAAKAQEDINSLSDELDTVTNTMQADYARKTELTEATASLQSQISQNAAEISSMVSQVTTIDETANNAQEQAQAAQNTADTAQAQADKATADAKAAQNAADEASAAATAAQNEADTAKAAAATAQSVADKAEADLKTAKADLATVSSRVDATEEDIVAAQKAVEAAQTAVDNAQAEASTAKEKAADAQEKAATAVTNATNAQTVANDAATQAALAQKVADEAKGDASAAIATADEAAAIAANAQQTANDAVTTATEAQARADEIAQAAADAQTAADNADAKAAQAAADLETAKRNLAAVTSRVDATEADVQAAQTAVDTAQAAADKAQEEAEAAQATADTAKANAATAQTAANNAKAAADEAQRAADEAQQAADEAQAAVDALAVRVTTAETKITQNSEQIALMAKKSEVTQTLGGYYTKTETDAAIKVKADAITSAVSSTYATKQEVKDIEVGGRNLAVGTSDEWIDITITSWSGVLNHEANGITNFIHNYSDYGVNVGDWLTFGIDLTATGKPLAMRVDYRLADDSNGKANYGNYIPVGETGRSTVTIQIKEEYPIFKVYVGSDGTVADNTLEQYKCLKIEKGNKATDWTAAPEDVESDIDAAQTTADQASESATEANERVTTAESLIQQLSNCIATLIKDGNGESLMTQTGDGWSFNMAQISDTLDTATADIDALVESLGGVDNTVNALEQAVADLGILSDYVIVTTYEGQPCIELGEAENGFKLRITNTQIQFLADGAIPAWLSNQKLFIEKAEVTDELQFGGFVWKTRSNGNMGLSWKGVSS